MKANCNCDYCGKPIYKLPNQLKKYKKHYCNNACSSKTRAVKETRSCDICSKSVTRKPSEFGENVFCSRDCYYEFNRVLKSKKQLTDTRNCSYCGNLVTRRPSEFKNKKYFYCNMHCKDKHNGELFNGINHHRWNPDLTEEERIQRRKNQDYIQWRKHVYGRDKYTCQCCGDDKGGNLVAHHIYNFSEHEKLRHDIDNGMTLCNTCHKLYHDEYGYTGNNQKQLDEFLQRQANQLPITLVTV